MTHLIPQNALSVTGFSILEANSKLMPFQANWFNVWEAYLHKKAHKVTGKSRYLFKRFSIDPNITPASERLRKTGYRDWLNGLNQACKQAFDNVERKQLSEIRKGKTALVYFDSWGETALFEETNSWRDALSIDMLPKAIARDYRIKDFSCKLRGERNGFLHGLHIAMDSLNSNMVDTVLLCGQFRSIPVLVLSELALGLPKHFSLEKSNKNCHVSVERVSCLILRKRTDNGPHIAISDYFQLPKNSKKAANQLVRSWQPYFNPETSLLFHTAPPSPWINQVESLSIKASNCKKHHSLTNIYGDSGCINPMLALQYLKDADTHHPHALVNAIDGQGGVWLMEFWQSDQTVQTVGDATCTL